MQNQEGRNPFVGCYVPDSREIALPVRRAEFLRMSELPKLLNLEKVEGEKHWTYFLKIIFNYLVIKTF
jgi:hypothetical protein